MGQVYCPKPMHAKYHLVLGTEGVWTVLIWDCVHRPSVEFLSLVTAHFHRHLCTSWLHAVHSAKRLSGVFGLVEWLSFGPGRQSLLVSSFHWTAMEVVFLGLLRPHFGTDWFFRHHFTGSA
jgi:hypothetical protein